MRSYLLSVLATRHRAHDVDIFQTANPWDWVVWEPGPWKPAAQDTLTSRPVATAPAPKGTEALALALVARDGANAQVTLGRGQSCDLVINDGTLSSLHLVFMHGPSGWTVRDAGSRNGTVLRGAKLMPGQPKPLQSGDRLNAGSVVLTFYEPGQLLERLRLLP